MRADERQAARAYAYAWWMTGDEDAAGTALGAGLATPEPDEPDERDDSARLVVLMQGVRAHLGDLRTMPPSSELALLHDGFDLPLAAAAELAGVAADEADFALAHGRLVALLETVREDFEHADRLGGLAVGNPEDVAHASQCRSCGRALVLIERGRTELREVSPVSAPPGMIAGMVADAAPAEPAAPGEPGDVISVEDLEDMLRQEAPSETPAEAPVDEAPPVAAAPVEAPPVEPRPTRPRPAPERPYRRPRERVPMSSARKTVAALLAGAGVLVTGVLLMVVLSSNPSSDPPVANDPADEPAPQPSASADPSPSPGRSPFDPPARGGGFEVTATGLLLPGGDELAPAGASLSPDDPIRIAVDYVNGSKGEELNAVWRVDDNVYERLRTVVSGRASRHVWGLPVPSDGWPTGRHRISVTTSEGLAGTIDFTIE